MHSSFFWSLMNSGVKYPRSIFNPSVVSAYVSVLWLLSTVTIPFFPTSLYTPAMMPPMFLSLFAEMVATSASMVFVNFLPLLFNFSTTNSLTSTKLRSSSVRFNEGLASNWSKPLRIKASVRTMLVVVPSPASVAVRSEACLIIFTAKFSIGSIKSIDLATVTPSLVTVSPCVWFGDSISTVLPFGPSVLLTALESFLIPLISWALPCSSNDNSFGEYPGVILDFD